jgi:hypothetical protein
MPAPAIILPVAALATAITSLATTIGLGLTNLFNGDQDRRSAFTKQFVTDAGNTYPAYNVVMVHTAHSASGEYVHQHVEFPISLGRSIGYEVYFAQKGRPFALELKGDGGYLNWAYNGEFSRNGNTITAIQHG